MGNGSFSKGRGNKRWGKAGAVAVFTLMVSAITHSGWYAPSSAVAANPMLHNSQVLGSSKWAQGWGVAGGKYGAFDCSTCHIPNSSNIKWVRPTVTVLGNFSSTGTSSVAVRFANVTSMGHDNRTPATSSANICEACHTRTKYHNYNTTRNSVYGGNLTHNNGADCISVCHPHANGFKPSSGSCTSCHGNPPTSIATLVSTKTYALGNPETAAGAHDRHVNVRQMTCEACHKGYSSVMGNGNIEMGFQVDATTWPQFNSGQTVSYGSYTGNSTLGNATGNTPYQWGATPTGSAQAIIGRSAGENSCGFYCHGNWPGSGGSRPDWAAAGSVTCGKCHGATAAAPPTRGSHLKHAGNGTKTGYSISCSTCHPNRLSGNVAHITGNVQWQMSTTKTTVGSGATYKGAASGSTGTLAPSASYGSCGTVYCHSDGRTTPTFNSPTWGSAPVAGCVRCHGNAKGSATVMTSNVHKAHVDNTSAKFAGTSLLCGECHNQVVAYGNNTSIISRTLHVNKTPNVDWGGVANIGSSTAYSGGTCSKVYCHSNAARNAPTYKTVTWSATDGTQGTLACDGCHGGLQTDTTVQTSNKHGLHTQTDGGGTAVPHVALTCDKCHAKTMNATGTALLTSGSLHVNGNRDARFKVQAFTNRSGAYNSTGNSCTNTYCHGNTASGSWLNGNAKGCGACHGTSNVGAMSTPHNKHYNSGSAPNSTTAWLNTANSTATTYVFQCGICHNTKTGHVNGPQVSGQGDAQLSFNLPFGGGTNSYTKGAVTNTTTTGYNYSTATTCSVYCHSSGKATWTGRSVSWNSGSVTCGSCHSVSAVKQSTDTWSAGHNKHMVNYSSNSNFRCGTCHVTTITNGTNTALVTNTKNHVNGYRNISSAAKFGNGTKTLIYNRAAGTCSSASCHSSGKATPQYSTTPAWGTGSTTCLSCHGGRNGTGAYVASTGGFGLSTTHYRHLKKYTAAQINCQTCHYKTAADNTALKNYTGVRYHANSTRNVTMTAIYGSYTSYKGTKRCGNTECHGGTTRNVWSDTAVNNDNTCVKCHGAAGVNSTDTALNKYAPGWNKVGTDTDGKNSRNAVKTGAHFRHLSSAFMRKIKCNECHVVPGGVYDAGHFMGQPRYNSTVLKFNQASSATMTGAAYGALPTRVLPSSLTYTAGASSTSAAVCSTVYCHGNRLHSGDTAGTYRTPYWNYSGLINATPSVTTCSRCHSLPPASVSSHAGLTSANFPGGCTCHNTTMNTTNGAIINRALHINGVADRVVSCTGCHATRQGSRAIIVGGAAGAEGDDFIRASHHVNNGSLTSIVTDFDCIICHAAGDTSSTTGNIKTVSSLHGGDTGNKLIYLRNVDTPGSNWTWPGKRLATFTATTTDRDNMDSFCMGCHDANGANGINVNASNNGLNLSSARAFTPFNTADTLIGNNSDPAILKTFKTTTWGKVVDVKSQFNSTNQTGSNWASHHNLNQFNRRYNARNTTYYPNALFTTTATKESTNLQTTGETTGLHCSDCHLNEANAHGAKSRYMLQTNTGTDAVWSGAGANGTGTHVCWKCHSSTIYSSTGSTTVGHHDHSQDSSRTMTTITSPMGIVCFNCHGGYSSGPQGGLGAIHGTNETYSPVKGTTTSRRYRFMNGGNWKWYSPTSGTYADPTSWTTGTAMTCYTESSTTGVWNTSCTSHSSGTNGSLNSGTAKPLSW